MQINPHLSPFDDDNTSLREVDKQENNNNKLDWLKSHKKYRKYNLLS